MYKLQYSPLALEDLQQIKEHIGNNWGKEVAIQKIWKIVSDINNLSNYPHLGFNLGGLVDVPTDYRYIFSEHNYIFYVIREDAIKIIRVLNERQDYMKHLFN